MSANGSDGGGCLGQLVAALLVTAAFSFFIPLCIPFEPKGSDLCDRRGGFVQLQGSLVDLVQNEGMVTCGDGTVRWVEKGWRPDDR